MLRYKCSLLDTHTALSFHSIFKGIIINLQTTSLTLTQDELILHDVIFAGIESNCTGSNTDHALVDLGYSSAAHAATNTSR